MQKLTAQSVVGVSSAQVSCSLDDEAVVLNLSDGTYYGLNPVGNAIWQLVQQPRAVAEILAAIRGEYDVEPGRCEQDVLSLLEDLLSAGLIQIHDQPRP